MSESLATAGSPSTSSACRVDRVDLAGEPAALRVGEELLPIVDSRRLAPHHGHDLGAQRGPHALGLGAVLASHGHGLGRFGRLDVEAHRDDTILRRRLTS